MTFSPILCAAAVPWSKNGEKSRSAGFMVCTSLLKSYSNNNSLLHCKDDLELTVNFGGISGV